MPDVAPPAGDRAGRPADAVGGVSVVSFVGATLCGLWFSHEIEYVRAGATPGLAGAAGRAVHTYLSPLGGVLAVLTVIGGAGVWRLQRRLRAELAALRDGRPGTEARSATPVDGRLHVRFWPLAALVWLFQVMLYLVQENLEAAAARSRLPGVGALMGAHIGALVVHAAVALLVALVLWWARRRIELLAAEVTAAADAVRRRMVGATVRLPVQPRWWTPSQRWGVERWSRPPPVRA